MRNSLGSIVATLPLLTACATAPRPAQKPVECPQIPALVLDVPARDWQGQMRDFLQGTLPTQPDYKLPSSNVKLPTIK